MIDAYNLQKLGGQRHWKQAEGKSGIVARKKNLKNRSLTNFKQFQTDANIFVFQNRKNLNILKRSDLNLNEAN